MAALPHPWDAYATHQAELSNRASADDRSWGLEAGLNRILEEPNPEDAPHGKNLARVISNATRRSRYARELLARHFIFGEEAFDVIATLDANADLRQLEKALGPQELLTLVAAAYEDSGEAAAELCGVSYDTFRQRLTRIRKRLRAILKS